MRRSFKTEGGAVKGCRGEAETTDSQSTKSDEVFKSPIVVWMQVWVGEWEAEVKRFGLPWRCWKVLCKCTFTICSIFKSAKALFVGVCQDGWGLVENLSPANLRGFISCILYFNYFFLFILLLLTRLGSMRLTAVSHWHAAVNHPSPPSAARTCHLSLQQVFFSPSDMTCKFRFFFSRPNLPPSISSPFIRDLTAGRSARDKTAWERNGKMEHPCGPRGAALFSKMTYELRGKERKKTKKGKKKHLGVISHLQMCFVSVKLPSAPHRLFLCRPHSTPDRHKQPQTPPPQCTHTLIYPRKWKILQW